MHRAFAILKYFPAVLCGLLVVAWAVSLWISFGITSESKAGFTFDRGCFWIWDWRDDGAWYERRLWLWSSRVRARDLRIPFIGEVAYLKAGREEIGFDIRIPVFLVLSLLLPLTIAPVVSFRFPLWSYFAWTALLGAELAYYLR